MKTSNFLSLNKLTQIKKLFPNEERVNFVHLFLSSSINDATGIGTRIIMLPKYLQASPSTSLDKLFNLFFYSTILNEFRQLLSLNYYLNFNKSQHCVDEIFASSSLTNHSVGRLIVNGLPNKA